MTPDPLRGCTLLMLAAAVLAIIVALAVAIIIVALAPRSALQPAPASVMAVGFEKADEPIPSVATGARSPAPRREPSPVVVTVPDPSRSSLFSESVPALTGAIAEPLVGIQGTASWGYGWSGVVTRFRRGSAICVTGPLGRWCGRSVGYGPAVRTHRIADLSRAVFRAICGDPSIGLCHVEIEVRGQ